MARIDIGSIGCGNISNSYLKGAARSELVRVRGVDTKKRDYRDRDRMNVHEDYELRYWGARRDRIEELNDQPRKYRAEEIPLAGMHVVEVLNAFERSSIEAAT